MPMHLRMAESLVGAGGWGYFSGGLAAYAQAFEACIAGGAPVPGPVPFTPANDPVAALWTGLRAAHDRLPTLT